MSVELARYARTFALKVETTTQQLVGENNKRKGLLVYNNGTDTVYIIAPKAAGKENGIPVLAGASYENNNCYGEYWIAAESGTQDVRVEEDTD